MLAVPQLATLATYSGAALLLILTPGPDMALFLSRTIGVGRAAGFAAMAGVMVGLLVHTLLATLGLSALVAASPTAFGLLRIVGAVYLLWLAWGAWRNGSGFDPRGPAGDAAPGVARAFATGVAMNVANPKIVLFFLTFLPQFVDPASSQAAAEIAFLGVWYVVLSVPICSIIILGAARVADTITGSPRIRRALDRTTAAVFALFAVKLALSRA
jgi:threonine/homoserine/homoserine lactone efflux protein